MTFKEFDELMHRYIEGNCTVSEEQLIEKWLATMEQEDRHILDGPQRVSVEKRLWAKLEENGASKLSRQRFLSGWQISGIAASLLVVAISLFMFIDKSDLFQPGELASSQTEEFSVFNNSTSAVQKVALADGSTVSLEPGSELRYTSVISTISREVHLTGEAFFEVAEDKTRPFLVYSSGITTRVLGTTFRVKAYDEDKEIIVSVSTGKVSVFRQSDQQESNDKEPEVILTPNQQAVYNKREDIVARSLIADPQIVLPESTLKSHYYNVAVADIFETLEKNYGIDIEFDEETLSACTLTTTLANESLYEKMEIICQVIGAQYTVNGTTIVVESQGCD